MNIATGKFGSPREHHVGWFRVFRFGKAYEIWFGKRWINVSW